MGHAGASRKSPNDVLWETLSLRLSRPISAPLLTVARSWRHEEEDYRTEYGDRTLKTDATFIGGRSETCDGDNDCRDIGRRMRSNGQIWYKPRWVFNSEVWVKDRALRILLLINLIHFLLLQERHEYETFNSFPIPIKVFSTHGNSEMRTNLVEVSSCNYLEGKSQLPSGSC